MDNREVAAIFYEVADILDLQGIAFKPNAYRRAARGIEQLDDEISKLASERRLQEIPGVGESVAKKIEEIVKTGKLSYLDKLRGQIPPGLLEILRIPDVGPKTAMVLNKELGISDIEQLKKALDEHRIRGLKGFGEKTEERIRQGIGTLEAKGRRLYLDEAYPVASAYVEFLKSRDSIELVSIAGSLRRGKETVGDIDILVGDDHPERVMNAFVSYQLVKDVLMKGPTKSSVVLRNGLQVDIRVVDSKSYGSALVYFTGSKDHNVDLRRIGIDLGLKVSEYGVFERDSGSMVAGDTEERVYRSLGLPYIPPELRESAGEIEAGRAGTLPKLVEQSEIKGDLHTHTNWTDGSSSIEDVVSKAIDLGYQYVAITDHSPSLKITHGLPADRLKQQIGAIRKVEEKLEGHGVRVLAGCEVDIKADGSLDHPSSVLGDLDMTIGSVHSRFKMDKNEMTKRIVTAIESGGIDILGHPTGRIIGQRNPYEFDVQSVFSSAKESGVCMEINSFPNRLDLSDVHCRLAKDSGLKMSIGTDAHSPDQMDYMFYGVTTARRGWLEAQNVMNTMTARELTAFLRSRRG